MYHLDHACCFGYPCLIRLSTFMAIVAANKNFDIYLTSTPPNQLRFRVLNANSNFKARISMYYFSPMRIDLYRNDTYIAPTNAYYKNGNMMLNDPDTNITRYMPTYNNTIGTNLFYKPARKMFFTIGGADYIDLKIAPVLFVKFGVPPTTEDAFFNTDTLVQNFADLLGIDASRIRRVEIIRATGRRKRDATSDEIHIALTIFDNAETFLANNTQVNATSADIQKLEAAIINKFATGQLQADAQAKLNVSLGTFLLQKASQSNASEVEITKVKKIVVVQEANNCNAQVPCAVQPILQVVDENVRKFKAIHFL